MAFYAETHFKFRLPWSPLAKPWPELFIDAPFQCLPGISPPFFLVAKDCHFHPVQLEELSLVFHVAGQKQVVTLPGRRLDQPFHFQPLEVGDFLRTLPRPCRLTVDYQLRVRDRRGRSAVFFNGNFPGLQSGSLQVHLLESPLPYPAGWTGGELHCHSNYSSDPVEFGASLACLQEAATAAGLGYLLCTDHSYDFYYDSVDYMRETDPVAKFRAYQDEVAGLNETAPAAVSDPGTASGADLERAFLIAGEEVSCANHRGENIHLLVAGHPDFLPGLGDGGRRWLNNKPDLTLPEVWERLGATPSFAAHPKAAIGRLERFIFRRGQWHFEDLQAARGTGFCGLQFWNGSPAKRDFQDGRAFWISALGRGLGLFPYAANDAHGDLNQNTGVKVPLFSLYQGRSHILGKARTVVKPARRDLGGLQRALAGGPLCLTEGPFVEVQGLEEGKPRALAWSNPDFGSLQRLLAFMGDGERESIQVLYEGRRGAEYSLPGGTVDSPPSEGGPFHLDLPLATSPAARYFRLEAWTSRGLLAMSSACFRTR